MRRSGDIVTARVVIGAVAPSIAKEKPYYLLNIDESDIIGPAPETDWTKVEIGTMVRVADHNERPNVWAAAKFISRDRIGRFWVMTDHMDMPYPWPTCELAP